MQRHLSLRTSSLGQEVELVYRQAIPGFVATLVNAVVLWAVLRGSVNDRRLTLWITVVTALTLARAISVLAFHRDRARTSTGGWRCVFCVGALGAGATWGALALVFPVSVAHQMVIGFALAGMTAGATPFLAPVPSAYVAYVVPALVPFIVRLYLVGSPLHVAMSAMTTVFLGVMLITARRMSLTIREAFQLRHQQRDLEGRLGLLFLHSPVAILEWDRDLELAAANPAARRLLSIVGSDDAPSIDEPAREMLRGLAARAQPGAVVPPVNAEIMLAGGTRLDCDSYDAPIPGSHPNEFAGVVSVLVDTRERDALVRAKASFVAAVSHELRSPLTTVRGSLGLLAAGIGGRLDDEGRSLVTVGLQDCARLSNLVEAILDFEGATGPSEGVVQASEVMPIVESSVAAQREEAARRQVYVRVTVSSDMQGARAACSRLRAVLDQVLDNAVAFAPPGSEVDVSVKRERGNVAIAVVDRGEGIPLEYTRGVFAPFSQGDGSTTRRKGGTGMGLSISRALIERSGGHLTIVRRADQGTELLITLPEKAA